MVQDEVYNLVPEHQNLHSIHNEWYGLRELMMARALSTSETGVLDQCGENMRFTHS
jgi:hypothetical protein